jgi:hypothetical protein
MSFKSRGFSLIKGMLKPFLQQIDDRIPKVDVAERHIAKTKVLVNRFKLLELLPKNAIVAELGVANGDFSQKIWDITSPQKFHIIDFWGSSRYNTTLKNNVLKRFEDQITEGKVEINLGLSTGVVSSFKDDYFDWIYIDTDHSYLTTKEELELYAPKMKKGGIIAGHDFVVGNMIGMNRYGVMEAVYEFCVKNEWEIVYLTSEVTDNPSFAIKKI